MKTKRGVVPQFWKIERKTNTFTTSTSPGSHPSLSSIPLRIIIRDIFKVVENASEARIVLNAGKVQVDGIVRKDPGFPAGLMDVVHLPDTQKHYRVMPFKQGLFLKEMTKDYDKKLLKIINKRILKGGKIQLNLHDGSNIITNNAVYKPNDVIAIKIPSREIISHTPLETGVTVLITGGKNMGKIAKLKEKRTISGSRADELIVETAEGSAKTQAKFIFPIGKEKPMIDLGE